MPERAFHQHQPTCTVWCLASQCSAAKYSADTARPLLQRPGMVRVKEGGAAIDMEVWELPAEHFGSFADGIPAPLGISKVKLADGSWVSGFVCVAIGVEGGTDITALGRWRAWMARCSD
ncbi:allophanate hydrolase-related protein [Hydrogenophaga sp. SL48]|uniref:allophanate hydrolase-related protein n=1 Tax=Hydrogenophaga sp. SL48 TaxID=2806347 RepID=UPI003FA596CF